MTTETVERAGRVVLVAPIGGRVRLLPPRALHCELEIFDAQETIATVTDDERSERLTAPARGFLLRCYVIDDAIVAAGSPLVDFSITG